MTATIYTINTTCGIRYGFKNAKTGQISPNGVAKWKTAKGAANAAKRFGFSEVK